MKIGVLFIVSNFKSGGTESQLVEILKGMDRDRFKPHILCFERKGSLLGAVERLGIEIHVLGIRRTLSLRTFKALRRAAAWAERKEVRVVHTFHFHGALYGAVMKRMCPGLRLIVCEQGLTEPNRLRHRMGRRFYYPLADVILTNCEAVRQVIAARDGLDPGRIRVIYGGVDMEKFSPGPDGRGGDRSGDEYVIGCVGRLHPDKGQLLLAEAAPEILREIPEARIVVVGDGPQRGLLEEAIERRGIGSRFTLLGDRQDVPALLPTFDLVVLPSMNEGFANAALEAMACGVPVVASDAGGNTETVLDGRTGLTFPRGDARALGSAIARMAADRAGAAALAEAARRRVIKEFGVDSLVRRHQELYGEMVQEVRRVPGTAKRGEVSA